MKTIRQEILDADKVLILAGAGMSCDSGLPAFRTPEGFWNHYPPLKGREFESVSSPTMQEHEPELFAGFYLHRLSLYRETEPHSGYAKLLDMLKQEGKDYFVVTTNVDGHFKKAGFDEQRIEERHGSIHHWQCSRFSCKSGIFNAPLDITVNNALIPSEIPKCPKCGNLSRPSILMFNDFEWNSLIQSNQNRKYNAWYYDLFKGDGKMVILEIGAGQAIPTLRIIHNTILSECPDSLGYRINIDEDDFSSKQNMIKLTKSGKAFIDEIYVTTTVI